MRVLRSIVLPPTSLMVLLDAGVSSERVRWGQLTAEDMDQLLTAMRQLEELAFRVDDTPALTMGALRARERRLKRQRGLDLIVVYYLQWISSSRTDGRVPINQ